MARDDRLVTIYPTYDQVQAALIKMWLDSAGIPHIAVNRVISSVYPVDGMARVGFQVRAGDVDRAKEVLRENGVE